METSHEKERILQENSLILYLHFSTDSNPLMIWGHYLLPVPFYSSNIKKILKKILPHCSNNRGTNSPCPSNARESHKAHWPLLHSPLFCPGIAAVSIQACPCMGCDSQPLQDLFWMQFQPYPHFLISLHSHQSFIVKVTNMVNSLEQELSGFTYL